jgi:phosphatidate cytidylyltransferase
MKRIGTAILLIVPFLGVLFLAPPWAFLLLAVIFALGAAHEAMGLAEQRGFRPFRGVGFVATALLATSFYPNFPPAHWMLLLIMLLTGAATIRRGAPEPQTLGNIATTLLCVIYVGLLTSTILGLRVSPSETEGPKWIVFLAAVVAIGDAAAYYTGSAFGRHRMMPSISPKKTMEGLAGGLTASTAAAILVGTQLLHIDWLPAAILGFVVSLLGVLGDLFESALKRSAGVKDTSSIFPGHGGILDRIDSLLFAGPAVLVYVLHLY